MKIKIPETLWFETKSGRKIKATDRVYKTLSIPKFAKYQVSQFPCQLTTTYLKLTEDGSERIGTSNSSWSEDLVLAMANSKDYTLSQSILIAANACERCMNSLAHKYGINWGYSEYGEEWKKSNTCCEFCTPKNPVKEIIDNLISKLLGYF